MNDECLICKAPLEYLVQDEMTECAICHMHGPGEKVPDLKSRLLQE